jgi:cation transport ATPase
MAKAAGHPDYLTGPALTADLCGLAGIIQSGLLGIHISSPLELEKIAEADCFVIDDSAASWTNGNGSEEKIGDRLRQLGVKEVALLSHRPMGQIARLGEEIGADFVLGEQVPLDKAAFISQRRYFGHKVAYFGSMGANAPVAKAADVAIVVAESLEREMPEAGVVLRQADLGTCALLRLMGTGSIENRKTGLQVAFAFNLTCSAAAIFANFSILAVVAITNISTWLNYVRSASALQSAVDSAED